ncbi:MAG: diguanylate cyclase [Acidimicrobiia bacterium]
MANASTRSLDGPDGLDALTRFHNRISDRGSTDERDEVLGRIAAAIGDALTADQALVVLLEEGSEDVLAIRAEPDQAALDYDDIVTWLVTSAIEADETLLFSADEIQEKLGSAPGARSVMVSPIKLEQGLYGAVIAGKPETGFEPSDLRIMEAMANETSMVLGYSMRLESEQKQRQLADNLREVTATMASTLDLRSVLDGVLKGLDQVLRFDGATLMLRQDDAMRVVANRGFDGQDMRTEAPVPIASDPTIAELVEDRAPLIVSSWEDRPRGEYVGGEDVESFIGVPLIARNRVIGMLTVSTNQGHYRLEEALIVDAFGDHAAVAIQNARLFQRTQASLAKTETLYQVAQSVIAGSTLTETLQNVVDGVGVAIPADRVSLITMNPRLERVVHFVRGGPGRDRVVAADFAELWDGLVGHVMRERQPVISSSDRDDEREGPLARARREATEDGAVMVAPLGYRGKIFGVITAVNRRDEPEFTNNDLTLLEAMANQAAMAIENARLFEEVERLAVTDELTGLNNRRGFFDLGRREMERAQRTHRPVTALMLDLDGFKRINDTFGHAVGDEVLRHLGDRCRRAVRDIDLVGRYGGEEFCVLLPETDLKTALEVAERIRSSIADQPFDTAAGPLAIRISIGLALASEDGGETVETLLDRADTAMYYVKQEGGNAVKSAD